MSPVLEDELRDAVTNLPSRHRLPWCHSGTVASCRAFRDTTPMLAFVAFHREHGWSWTVSTGPTVVGTGSAATAVDALSLASQQIGPPSCDDFSTLSSVVPEPRSGPPSL